MSTANTILFCIFAFIAGAIANALIALALVRKVSDEIDADTEKTKNTPPQPAFLGTVPARPKKYEYRAITAHDEFSIRDAACRFGEDGYHVVSLIASTDRLPNGKTEYIVLLEREKRS